MRPRSEERPDAAIPGHFDTRGSPAAQSIPDYRRIDLRVQIAPSAGSSRRTVARSTLEVPPRRRVLSIGSRRFGPRYRRAHASCRLTFASRRRIPGRHLSTNSATRKLRAPAWTAGRAPAVPNEMSSASGSLRFGSNQDTNYAHFENRRRRGYPDSDCLASNHARRLGSPAVYPILQPAVWNPAVNRGAHPVELPDDNSIVPLTLASWRIYCSGTARNELRRSASSLTLHLLGSCNIARISSVPVEGSGGRIDDAPAVQTSCDQAIVPVLQDPVL